MEAGWDSGLLQTTPLPPQPQHVISWPPLPSPSPTVLLHWCQQHLGHSTGQRSNEATCDWCSSLKDLPRPPEEERCTDMRAYIRSVRPVPSHKHRGCSWHLLFTRQGLLYVDRPIGQDGGLGLSPPGCVSV